MEITPSTPSPPFEPAVASEPSTLKLKLGELRRRIKSIDLRGKVVTHPFVAVGIGAAAGALIGFVRPKPPPSKVTKAVVATLGAIAYRLVREAAVTQLGQAARDYFASHREDATGGEAY